MKEPPPQKLQPARPPSVKPQPPHSGPAPSEPPPDDQNQEQDEPGGGGADRDSERKPTPVRELAGSGSTPGTEEPDVAEVRMEIEEETWVVRVLGMAGDTSSGCAPLLLLGFWEVSDSAASPDREAITVGKTLGALSTENLEMAFKNATTPSDPERKHNFFEDLDQEKRR